MNEIEFCRACLIIDVRMCIVKKSHILKFYSKLMGNLNTPLILCYECITLLEKCQLFYDKCIKASNLLKLISSSQTRITKDTLRVLDRKEYCLKSFLNLATLETYELPIGTNESSVDSKYKLYVWCRSLNVPILAQDTIKVKNENKRTLSADNQPLESNEVTKIDEKMLSSNDIKDAALIQDESIESNKIETNKFIETQEASSRDNDKPEYCKPDNSLSCDNSDGEYDYTTVDEYNTKFRTRRKRKQRFVTEDVNKSYETKRTRQWRNMKNTENNSDNEGTSTICPSKNKSLKLRKNINVNKKVESAYEILYEGYMSVESLCPEKTQNKDSSGKKHSDSTSYVFECMICHENFNTEDGHKEHMKRHNDCKTLECDHCHLVFQKESDLVKHYNSDHKHKYSCKICSFTSISSHEAKAHISLHRDKEIKSENGGTEAADDRSNVEQSSGGRCRRKKSETGCKVAKTSGPPFDASYFEGYATFILLTPEEAQKEVISRKETPNFMYSEFKCDLCFRGFESKVTYHNHMKKHSPEHGEHECEFCHLRFRNQRYLNKHKLGAHKRKFSCKICPFVCFCSDQAKVHVKLHKGTKYPCKECGEIFSMPNSLLMHKRKKHLTTAVCDLCGSTFNTERGVRSHKLLAHREETNPRLGPACDLCDVHFANEAAWKKHIVLSAKHFVSNGCQHCGETFESENALKIHARVHARKQRRPRSECRLPGDCTMCGETLQNEAERRKHLLTAHPDSKAALSAQADETPQCVCEICGKMFKKPCFLNYHMRVHTGEKPYTCTDCGKSYAYSGVLSEHRATHTAHPQHRCHLCPKTFKFKSALYKHVRAHLGIRPHKCHFCDKSFPTPCELRSHTHHTHHKVPWPKRERRRQRKPTQSTSREMSYEYDN